MLLSLHVKNLALIEETEVEFQDGLNILSGETGAGKSIIIGSLNLALGEKVPREMLRENCEYALVELVFSVGSRQEEQLQALEVYPEDGQVIMSRRITSGRSVGKINSETVSASRMRQVASLLIDIHGQHEHQSLLQKRRHLEILDDYAKEQLGDKKERMAESYRAYQALTEELEQASTDAAARAREISFLEYEIGEITDAALSAGEDEELEQEYRRLSHGRRILEALGTVHELTGGGDGASDLAGRALRELSSVSEYDPALEPLLQQLGDIDGLLNDFNRELSSYQEDAEFSPEDFARVEQRLDQINHLKAKYGDTIEAILHSRDEKQERYEMLVNYEQYMADRKEQLDQAEEKLEKISRQVSKIRRKAASGLSREITKALSELNFLDVDFSMEFYEDTGYSANGIDDAEFLISTNPGEPKKPLGKVASGGELSRIMLAIKTILAENDMIETMIFDEIDAGISGRTAQMVAEKMNVIAASHQVICITHLPQIAAMADYHYLIEKNVVGGATVSNIKPLAEEEKIGELARMTGGVKITEAVLESAAEMRGLALSVKQAQREGEAGQADA